MRLIISILCVSVLISKPTWAAENPIVDFYTNYGNISVELAPDKAPLTVKNFLSYVEENFYENTLFHRVKPKFVIQGGGYSTDFVQKPTHTPIKLESNNGLSNIRGSIAMARTNALDSATAQFYINSVDNYFLDYQGDNNPGYAVFGQVISGLNVVDSISAVATNSKDVPLEPVIITAARLREAQLNFAPLKALYHANESLTLSVKESGITRKRPLDLWVAVAGPQQPLQFISPENTTLISTQAKPFKRSVSVDTLEQNIITFTVPKGLTGQYTIYAIFNEPTQGINDLTHSLQSNIASTTLNFQN